MLCPHGKIASKNYSFFCLSFSSRWVIWLSPPIFYSWAFWDSFGCPECGCACPWFRLLELTCHQLFISIKARPIAKVAPLQLLWTYSLTLAWVALRTPQRQGRFLYLIWLVLSWPNALPIVTSPLHALSYSFNCLTCLNGRHAPSLVVLELGLVSNLLSSFFFAATELHGRSSYKNQD